MSLISVDDLASRLDDESAAASTVVCDVRFYLADHDQARREYDAGHIPGAMFVDLHTELAGGRGGGRHPLPPADEFAALLGRLGISPATVVVVYDNAGGATAARMWWMLRSIGHGQAAVLDGGLAAWERAGHPVSVEKTQRVPTTYPPSDDWTGIVDADGVAEGAELGATVVDSRAPERYRGESEPIDSRAGHIPGAINIFHADNLAEDGTHLSIADLAARFAGIGDSPIVYCGSGVTACHNLLAMSLVGITRARLYPGSWSEWSSDDSRPIETDPPTE
jgi:thiosulfate/3-mercaptopyruvate sulfurtransferase